MSSRWLTAKQQNDEFFLHLGRIPSAAEAILALDSPYVFGTSGDSYASAFVLPESGTLTDFWVAVSSFTGTWTATDQTIQVSIRDGMGGNNKPGASFIGSAPIVLATSDAGKWVRATGLNIAITGGKLYSVTAADTDGGATNYVTMATDVGLAPAGIFSTCYRSSNGWNTNGTVSSGAMVVAMKVGGVVYGGGVFKLLNTLTSHARKRGNLIRVPERCTIVGFSGSDSWYMQNWVMEVELFNVSDPPTATPLWGFTLPVNSTGSATQGYPLRYLIPQASQYELSPGRDYRITVRPVGTPITTPRKATTYLGVDADLRTLWGPGPGGKCSYTEEDVAGTGWTDEPDSMCMLTLCLAPVRAVTIAS